MFERRKEKKAAEAAAAANEAWQNSNAWLTDHLEMAQIGRGSADADGILLKSGEEVFAEVQDTALIEDRRGAGQWEGRSRGVSIPVGSIGGRSVRYRVGSSKGHFVQGEMHPEAVDTGTTYVTNQRVVFVGAKQTRECLFSKLVAIHRGAPVGATTFSVSNRQKPTVIYYGPAAAAEVDFRIDLAAAIAVGNRDAFIAKLQRQLAELETTRPAPPSPPAMVPPPPPAVSAQPPPPQPSANAWTPPRDRA